MGFKLRSLLGAAATGGASLLIDKHARKKVGGLLGLGPGESYSPAQRPNYEGIYAPKRAALQSDILGPGGAFAEMRRRTTGGDVAMGRFGSPVAEYGAIADRDNAGRQLTSGLAELSSQQARDEAGFDEAEAGRKYTWDQGKNADKTALQRLLLGTAGGVIGGMVGGPPGAAIGSGLGQALTPQQARSQRLWKEMEAIEGRPRKVT